MSADRYECHPSLPQTEAQRDRLYDALTEMRALHHELAGTCTACAHRWPCPSERIAAAALGQRP